MGRPVKELEESWVTFCLLRAMMRLRKQGITLVGPQAIGEEAASEYGKPVVSTLASHHLKRLSRERWVIRYSQGSRRGLYRINEARVNEYGELEGIVFRWGRITADDTGRRLGE